MQVKIEAFFIHKTDRGGVDESEDAFASSEPLNSYVQFRGGGRYSCARFAGERLRLAVSDGISVNSYETGYWAESLAGHFVAQGFFELERLSCWVKIAQEQWKGHIAEIEPVDIFEREQKLNGAAATLLGVEIEDYRYRIFAVGDSYAVHVRGDEIIQIFPKAMERSNAQMVLSSSDLAYNGKIEEKLSLCPEDFFASGLIFPGDAIFLMTDALAYNFLAAPNVCLFRTMGAKKMVFRKSFWQYREGCLKKGCLTDDDITMLRASFK
ncbi:hypothetical protein FACS1894204_09950 [Synergistales bacterium]|nr:hypothetical protein FACS1894204_09950 [Synergistales bacterium]